MNSYVRENIIKNIIVIVIAALLWPVLSKALSQIKAEQTNDLLLAFSILLVTVCFANFAFTYEKSRMRTIFGKLVSHTTTGIFMLLTALLLESTVITVKTTYPFLNSIIFGFAALLYLGIVLYDLWDILRANE